MEKKKSKEYSCGHCGIRLKEWSTYSLKVGRWKFIACRGCARMVISMFLKADNCQTLPVRETDEE